MAPERSSPAIATYRVQLHSGFPFSDAAAVADYLAELGVSHLYASPLLRAAPGSSHGYDVVDYSLPNDELGGIEGFADLTRVLKSHGIRTLLDIVPNHMSVAGKENQWWWDILENGPSSPYASYFDIEWDSPEEKLRGKLLLPILGERYGSVLAAGELGVAWEEGKFVVRYFDHTWPLSPRSLAPLIRRAADRCACDELAFVADAYGQLLPYSQATRDEVQRSHRNQGVLRRQLGRLRDRQSVAEAIDGVLAEINADPVQLDRLLTRQNYRLAYWRSAAEDLGYRRFFDINTLVGVNAGDEEVFPHVHQQILDWVAQGLVHGLRIDHVDGLRDPQGYLERLRDATGEAWIVVEKILGEDERLPSSWPISGTSGYDALRDLNGVFVDARGKEPMTEVYEEFTGIKGPFPDLAYECKQQILQEVVGSDLNRLTDDLVQICEAHWQYRDFTRRELYSALCETLANFPVYRTYVRPRSGTLSDSDREYLSQSIEHAQGRREDLDSDLFEFLGKLLSLELRGESESRFVERFQQLSCTVMAKGVEDTAFYRFFRLSSLNEVGGEPQQFGTSLEELHHRCQEAQSTWPDRMVATSTHDTKRSEDVRMRIHLLAEMPQEWRQAVHGWSTHNAGYWEETRPDRNIEYLFYQTLVGTWPISTDRVVAYLEKAMREAKLLTSWTRPDAEYETAVRQFAEAALSDGSFCSMVEQFVQPLLPLARVMSLAQTLLKLTVPGIPDIFQGTEIWDHSLVDPDNRRSVDYSCRREMLKRLEHASPTEILEEMESGLPKLWVIRQALRLRRDAPHAFGATGEYHPILAQGDRADHVIAFARGDSVCTVVPRLLLRLDNDWGDTSVQLGEGEWESRLTAETFSGEVRLRNLLERFPVALLQRR